MRETFTITSAKYLVDENGNNDTVACFIDGTPVSVPLDPANRHYAEILKQVADGTLTIADAD